MTRTITIPAYANGVPGFLLEVVAAAAVFHCIATQAAFQVRVDEGPLVPISAGKGFGGQSGKQFHRIGFYNSETVPVVVTYYAGLEPWTDPNGAQNNIVTIQPLGVFVYDEINPFYAFGKLTIPNNTSLDILTAYRIGDRVYPRKNLHVTNTTAGRDLELVTLYGAVPDYTNNILSFAVEGRCIDLVRGDSEREFGSEHASSYFRIWNKSGATITCPIWLSLDVTPLPGYY